MRMHPDFDFTGLSAPDRIRLALALWDSLDAGEVDVEFPLTPAQAADLDRRVGEMDRDGDPGLEWEAVVERARSQVRTGPHRG